MNWIYGFLLFLASLGVAYWYGGHRQKVADDAVSKAALSADKIYSAKLEDELKTAKVRVEIQTVTQVKEVPKYVTRYIPVPGAASVARPAYYLTWGAVGLYSDALCDAGRACGTVETPTSAGPFDLSPYDFGRVEQNAIENYGRYTECRQTVAGWQSWYAEAKRNSHN